MSRGVAAFLGLVLSIVLPGPGVSASCGVAVPMPEGVPDDAAVYVTGIAARFDGHAWGVGVTQFASVHGGEAAKVWRFGDAGWSTTQQSFPGYLADADMASGERPWIVGEREESYPVGAVDSVIRRWDGSAWRDVADDPANWGATDVTVVGPRDVWVAALRGSRESVLQHWDGRRWSVPAVPVSGRLEVHDVEESSGGEVWAVASAESASGSERELLLRWNGKRWRSIPVPPVPGPEAVLHLWTVAAGHGSAWVAGSWRRVPHGVSRPLIAVRSDGVWSRIPPPDGAFVNSLALVGDRVVALSGSALRLWGADAWTEVAHAPALTVWWTLAVDRAGRVWVGGARYSGELYGGSSPFAARFCLPEA